ncbi:MAG: hypothetical protein IPL61_15255 [Myxococcales bacterium]|nr:hypothetical protein [Myxococcales bacterium]
MSRAVRMATAAALALASGCLAGDIGHPQAAFRLGHGNAIAAAGTSRGTSASIVYADHGGPLTRTALFIPRLLNAPASPVQGKCSDNVLGTVTTCVYWVTQAGLDEYKVKVAAWQQNLMTGKSSAETSLEVASTALGGDTSGFRFTLDYPLFGEGRVLVKAGVGFGMFTMHGRSTRTLTATPTSVQVVEATADVKSSHLALPLTVLVALPQSVLASYRLEWNLLRYQGLGDGPNETYHPQVSRFGLERMLAPYVRLGVELQIDGVRARSSTVSAELGVAF